MALSASDIRSALSLPQSTPAPAHHRKTHPSTTKKPDGISRELYSLIGPSAPSLAAHLAKPRLRQKPNLGGGGTVKWEHRPFGNSARSDTLQLFHWVKLSDPIGDYPFAKYNVQPQSYTYSQDEYSRLLEDSEWTKEETDYLFSIVQEYDLRWYVIHDRYNFPDGPIRAIEDLKDRYYSVCRKLIRNRPCAGDESSRSQLLNSYQFDKEREKMRKNYVASLEDRTPEEIAEEEALFVELKRLEQNERKFRKERDDLLRTLLGADSGLPDIVVEEDGPAALSIEGIRKKKKGGPDFDLPPTPSNIIQLGPPVSKRPPPPKSAVYDAQHCIVRVDPPAGSSNTTKVTHVPAHLRSFKLPVPKATIAPKVAQALAELGITYSRLVMPTRDNCSQLESLLDATTALIETKKIVDRVEQDIRVLKARLGIRESESADRDPKESTPMDVDESKQDRDGEGEGRAQSVIRGRKQLCRSISVSSIDTSASLPTRTGTKRQKRG
ncbi:hypothetical protein JVT61DRAFT_13027 [Boletus reticuloceps]|uniref:SWR1-complex protein 4 n=1 Tax=Boletus reticuloceps TaxID=495285 RepID=A0A8I2YT73_9AGAM|nr:hypothetical protein JVT61DRAFT_13027 [Boletus reticuloceps]